MKDLNELQQKISAWQHARGITINGNTSTQTLKLMEEVGELSAGLLRNDDLEIKDAIGDIFVVLNSIAELEGLELSACISGAYNEIKDRTGTLLENGNFLKDSGDLV